MARVETIFPGLFRGVATNAIFFFESRDSEGICINPFNSVYNVGQKVKWDEEKFVATNATEIATYEGYVHDEMQERYDDAAGTPGMIRCLGPKPRKKPEGWRSI